MRAIIQEEKTGCAIASAAALAGISYKEAKSLANSMGIHVEDSALWSGSENMRRLLERLGISTGTKEQPFTSWESLPDCALLAIKWHLEHGVPCWHWVVFSRGTTGAYVLDPRKGLKTNTRTDFGRMQPKWYIEVTA